MGFPKGLRQGRLTPKQLRFCELYANPASTTFGNATKSYIAAGYKNGSGANVAACRLLSNNRIYSQLAKHAPEATEITIKKREIKAEYADQELIAALEECKPRQNPDGTLELGDMTNRVALIRLYMQRCGLLQERVVVDLNDSRQLEQQYRNAARKIASIVLESGGLPPAVGAGDGSAGGCLPGVDGLIDGCFEPVMDNNTNTEQQSSYNTDTPEPPREIEQSLLSDVTPPTPQTGGADNDNSPLV